MQINIENLLQELLRFDRKTNNKVKVDKMVHVVARVIKSEVAQAEETARCVLILDQMREDQEGHA